jgi:hypothetical protein
VCDEPAADEADILVQALKQLRSAIAMLDEARAPEHIAAHVDLAVHQLADFLGTDNREQQVATSHEHFRAKLIK